MAGIFDLAVIGGGINGAGIARDAAGRGLSVYLCEMDDLASGTSSSSTKLIHGGLRYLEQYRFRLVREALIERETLWHMAPHLIEPMRFVLPYCAGLRPAWLLRLGLFLYDYLGGRKLLKATRTVDLTRDRVGEPLRNGLFTRGFEYSDCRVDDARLVVLTAMDAATRGATIETRTRLVSCDRSTKGWSLNLRNRRNGEVKTICARALVNAAGPWVANVLSTAVPTRPPAAVRLVQGSHIVIRRLYEHDRCYIFQNADGRIVFVIPYHRDFTLIGTTDRDYEGDPSAVRATDEEIDYLCRTVTAYFTAPVTPADVIWAFSGVRPLHDDGTSDAQAATRDYFLELDEAVKQAPLLSVYGGKITTHRRLAEAALEMLSPALSRCPGHWTSHSHLPGGDFPVRDRGGVQAGLRERYPFLTEHTARRLTAAYGTLAYRILGDAGSWKELGCDFGAGLTEAEVDYLMKNEWAMEPADILWRRSKLGLYMRPEDIAALTGFMNDRTAARDVCMAAGTLCSKPLL